MGSGGGFLRLLFGVIVFVVFLGFLCIGTLAIGGSASTTAAAAPTTPTTGNFKHLDVVERERRAFYPDLDPNYMNKRRVPNGPDPIHNRRAGKSGQPPGRA